MKKMLFLTAVAAAWIACDRDDECRPTADDGQQITILAGIADSKPVSDVIPESKTTITGSTAAWKSGDQLGLFCTQSVPAAVNVSFSATGNGASATSSADSPIYWGAPATTPHTFLAYSPYASGNNSASAVKVPALNVQTGTVNPALDLLISNNLASSGVLRSAGAVGLVFTHALSLLEFDITINSSIAANTTLTSFTVAAGSSDKVYTTDGNSTIALSTGAITPGSGVTNTTTMTPGATVTLSATSASVYVLVLPGTYSQAPTLAINLNEGGTSAIAVPAASLTTTTFAAGSKYTYAVSIARTAITISNPTITDWTNVNGSAINPGL